MADADLPRHLHLGLALEVAQLHDPLFARGEGGHRLAEFEAADPTVLAVRVAHLIDDVHRVAAVGVERLFEAEGLHHRFQRCRHLRAGKARLPGDLVHGWLPAQLLFQRFPRLHGLVGRVPQRAADPQGVVIPQKTPDLADDHRHAVGGEPHVLGGVEVVDGLDEPDAAHLKQVVEVLAPLGEPLHHAEHQPQVALDHLLPRGGVARVGLGQQLPFLRFGQDGKLGRIHPAEFHFVVHPRPSGFVLTLPEVWGGGEGKMRGKNSLRHRCAMPAPSEREP